MRDGRIAVIGDVHGHLTELQNQLVCLGANPETFELPEDLTVIQVGDLIHRGPASHGVLQLVDRVMTQQPNQWIQLFGNHEAQYLYAPLFEWPEGLESDDQALLNGWLTDGKIAPAVAFTTDAGSDVLVTHAGITHAVWKILMSRPTSARDAANRICGAVSHVSPWLWRPGEMLTGMGDRFAGPLWAAAGGELVSSWLQAEQQDEVAPFHQVHGHSSTYWWQRQRWRTDADVQQRITLDKPRRHTLSKVAGVTIIGVDPEHGRHKPAPAWQPLVVQGVVHPQQPETPEAMAWLKDG